jgi:Notch-like protein
MWGAVCADTIDLQDAHVVCRMMGYMQAVTLYKQSGESFKFLTTMHCNGTENSTDQCSNGKSKTNTCRGKKDAWIICKPGSGEYFVVKEHAHRII